jgi:hypothetical protein
MIAADETLLGIDLRVTVEELAVLCRDDPGALASLLPETAGVAPLDVVERVLAARGMLELAAHGGTRRAAFADELVRALTTPVSIEHVTVDELGAGPGWWVVVAHGHDIAATITPAEVASVYDVSITGPYEPPAETDPGAAELVTTLARLESLLTARRDATLAAGPGDRAAAIVLGAASYVERVRRTVDVRAVTVDHRVLLDAGDLGTWELFGVPSPVDGDDAVGETQIAWVMIEQHDEVGT